MPVIDAYCPRCEKTEPELVATLATPPEPCACGGERRKAMSLPIVSIPAWMTDDGIRANARHAQWLKTPEAKAMHLERTGDNDA